MIKQVLLNVRNDRKTHKVKKIKPVNDITWGFASPIVLEIKKEQKQLEAVEKTQRRQQENEKGENWRLEKFVGKQREHSCVQKYAHPTLGSIWTDWDDL